VAEAIIWLKTKIKKAFTNISIGIYKAIAAFSSFYYKNDTN